MKLSAKEALFITYVNEGKKQFEIQALMDLKQKQYTKLKKTVDRKTKTQELINEEK